MRRALCRNWISLALVLCCGLFGFQASAQTDVESVELDLRSNTTGDSLLVYVRITGPTDFTGSVNEIKYTIRWEADGPSDINIDPNGLTQFCPAGYNIMYYQQVAQYPTTGPGAGYAYATMNAFGLPPISQACPDQVWVVGEWRLIQRISIVNIGTGCTEFQIVNDGYTAVTGRETYVELMGQEIPNTVEPTPAYIGVGGACDLDCLGEPGGPAGPGTPCPAPEGQVNGVYNSDCECIGQIVDCAGVAGGTAFVDNCGDCVGGTTGEDPCAQDCLGVWGGTAMVDACNVCYADGSSDPLWNTTCLDCHGDVNGDAFIDDCGVCVGGNTGLTPCGNDCAGVPGGTAFLDNCGDCVGGTTGEVACVQDCNNVWGGAAFIDECGNCVGGNTGASACEQDCLGMWGGPAVAGTPCADPGPGMSNGVWNADCECVGAIVDCAGVAGGSAYVDECGDCVGGTTGDEPCEQDCAGVWGGTAMVDDCNVCHVEGASSPTWNTTCLDCAGVVNGTAFTDDCGVCVGGTTGLTPCGDDCAGVPGGSAFFDNCGECVGGTTGEVACVQDCNNVWGGTAYLDDCGDCVGGNTGLTECVEDCEGVLGGTAVVGTVCDPGPGFILGFWNADCVCVGTPVEVYDCPALEANIGDMCDAGPGYTDGMVNADCVCEGTPVTMYDCSALEANIGDMCDAGPGYTDGMVNADCVCEGTPVTMYDCPALEANIGDMCDPGPGYANGMVNADCVCVGEPVAPGCTLEVMAEWGCIGESNGWAAVEYAGAVYPVSILWSTGADVQFVTGLPSGDHWVTVTDAAGCAVTAYITVDCEKDCDLEAVVEWGCIGESNGWASVEYTGGTTPTSILWSTGETVQFITGLSSGDHWVMVTDAEDCWVKHEFSVDCEKDEEPCALRTQTQGGWGAAAAGNNPGAYRNANFAGAFPGGLTIGCTNTLTLTTAAAVQAFLPSGTTARVLNAGHLVNPGNTYKNVLAGQLVALTLSVGFDNYDPDFGSGGSLADAVINTGTFQGWTVQQLLDEANNFIGGCGSMYTASQLNIALAMVNENFVDGTTNNGNVDCAPSFGTKLLLDNSASMAMRTYPVPATNTLNVDLMFEKGGDISIIMMDAVGRVVMQKGLEGFLAGEERTLVLDVNALGSGTYLLTVLRDGEMLRTSRIVVSH